jgi:hypothetical protein
MIATVSGDKLLEEYPILLAPGCYYGTAGPAATTILCGLPTVRIRIVLVQSSKTLV